MANPAKTINFKYIFSFPDEEIRKYEINLDYTTLELIPEAKESFPEWTYLENHQCSICPLKKEQYLYCPVAKNLSQLIDAFHHLRSIDEVEVELKTKERTLSAKTSLQNGLSGIVGLIMATSGCPILNRFRPMVDTHLPFMKIEESVYRILSMYVLAQYFRFKNNLTPDWKLDYLDKLMMEIHQVNTDFCNRLRSIKIKDAALNAIVALNISSGFVGMAHKTNWINRMSDIFLNQGGFKDFG